MRAFGSPTCGIPRTLHAVGTRGYSTGRHPTRRNRQTHERGSRKLIADFRECSRVLLQELHPWHRGCGGGETVKHPPQSGQTKTPDGLRQGLGSCRRANGVLVGRERKATARSRCESRATGKRCAGWDWGYSCPERRSIRALDTGREPDGWTPKNFEQRLGNAANRQKRSGAGEETDGWTDGHFRKKRWLHRLPRVATGNGRGEVSTPGKACRQRNGLNKTRAETKEETAAVIGVSILTGILTRPLD